LAFERDAPFAVDEFLTLNRCLDNAIADAVMEFTAQRDARVSTHHAKVTAERVGFLVHELRNALSTATLAASAIEFGNLNMAGARTRPDRLLRGRARSATQTTGSSRVQCPTCPTFQGQVARRP